MSVRRNASNVFRGNGVSKKSVGYRSPFEALENRSLMSATVFDQTNLVSDQFGVAQIQDKHLINPWGSQPTQTAARCGSPTTMPASPRFTPAI